MQNVAQFESKEGGYVLAYPGRRRLEFDQFDVDALDFVKLGNIDWVLGGLLVRLFIYDVEDLVFHGLENEIEDSVWI